jgi:hypothetical protein
VARAILNWAREWMEAAALEASTQSKLQTSLAPTPP